MNNRNVIRDKTTRTYAFFSLCSARLSMTKTASGKSETLLSHSLSFLLLTKPDTISPHSFFFMHLPVGQHSSSIEITVVERGFILFYKKNTRLVLCLCQKDDLYWLAVVVIQKSFILWLFLVVSSQVDWRKSFPGNNCTQILSIVYIYDHCFIFFVITHLAFFYKKDITAIWEER